MKVPRNSLLIVTFLFLFASFAFSSATDIYITPDGSTQGACTASPHPTSFFNSSSNWGSGSSQIGPGTIVHLCGTFTGSAGANMLTVQGNGSSGNPVTVLFESGARLSAPYWSSANGAIGIGNHQYITIDGNGSGVVEATSNGTGLANHSSTTAITSTGSNVEIKGLTISNLYIHTAGSDTGIDQTQVKCINFSGSNVSIHDNTMHDAGWCLYENYSNGDSNVSIYNNQIYHIDHGWMLATQHSGGSSGPFSFYGNHVYGYSNWDTSSNSYHHDGIHCFTSQTSGAAAHITALNIYDNLFEGPVGASITAHIFLEGGSGGSATPCADTSSPVYVYNNLAFADQGINNGLFGLFSGSPQVYNNTMISTAGTGAGVCYSSNSVVGSEVFENNLLSGCNQIINISGIDFTPDYNIYANGGSNAFVCNGKFYTTSQFSSWKSCIGGDSHSSYTASPGVSSAGVPQSGSPVIAAGTNLTKLGISALDSDKKGTARPSSGTWDIAAFQFSTGTSAAQPAPPSNLNAVVE